MLGRNMSYVPYFRDPEESVASPDALKAAIAELIGTMWLVFASCGAVVSTRLVLVGDPPVRDVKQATAMAVAQGSALTVALSSITAVSGGHVNPAVTFGTVLAGKLSLLRGFMYCVAQLLGAVLGAALLKAVTPFKWQGDLGVYTLGSDVVLSSGVLIEIVITFWLVFCFFATSIDTRAPSSFSSLLIGLASMVGTIAATPFTGGAMNPARSFGPCLVTNTWEDHWVYWVGPLTGAALASRTYMWFFQLSVTGDRSSCCYRA